MGRRNRYDDFSSANIFLPDSLLVDLNEPTPPRIVSHNRFAVLDSPYCRKRSRSRTHRRGKKPARVHRVSKPKRASLRLDMFDDLFSNKNNPDTTFDNWTPPTATKSSGDRISPSITPAQGVPLILGDSTAPEFPQPCLLLDNTFYHEISQNKTQSSQEPSLASPTDWKVPVPSTEPPMFLMTEAEKTKSTSKPQEHTTQKHHMQVANPYWNFRLFPQLATAYTPADPNRTSVLRKAMLLNSSKEEKDAECGPVTFLGLGHSKTCCSCGKYPCSEKGAGHLKKCWCQTTFDMGKIADNGKICPEENTCDEKQPGSPLSEFTALSESTGFEEVEGEEDVDGEEEVEGFVVVMS